MKKIKEYFRSVRFCLNYAFRFVPRETIGMIIIVVVTAGLPYGSAFLLGTLVNSIVLGAKSGLYTGIWGVLFLYTFISALPNILGNIRLYINRHWQLNISFEIDLDILKRREKIDIARYEDPAFQDLMQRGFRNGTGTIFDLASQQFDLIAAVASLIIGTALAVHFNWLVYCIVIVAAIPSFITDIKYASRGWSIWSKDSPEQRRVADLRQHIVSRTFLIETKLLQAGEKILSWIRKIMHNFMIVQLRLEKSRVLQTTLADLLSYFGFALAIFLVVRQVIAGGIQVGSLVYIMGTLTSVRSSIANILLSLSRQYESHLIVKDIQDVVETKPIVIESLNPTRLALTSAPSIVFENVGFKYNNSETWSLRHITLTLTPGYKIGLVGNNGAGKTTFVKLLARIYDPTEGRILVNGVDLRDISTAEWWSYLGIMFQDYASYDFAVKEAISIGRPDGPTDLARVKEAAHISQAHTFIEEWKDMYNQQLGVEFGGKEPSKGQRQKLAIAKIIYRNAFVMILDEPTASVDAESEAKIFDSLENLSKDTSAILISHDFSTISECDEIFVLDRGELLEHGSHKDLMKSKGLYAELYNLQAKRFKR